MSLRDQILAADDLQRRRVDVAAWGVTIEVRELSVRGRLLWREAGFTKTGERYEARDDDTLTMALLVACCFDPDTGQRIFGEADIEALREKREDVLSDLIAAALDLNGLRAESSLDTVDFTSAAPSSAQSSS